MNAIMLEYEMNYIVSIALGTVWNLMVAMDVAALKNGKQHGKG